MSLGNEYTFVDRFDERFSRSFTLEKLRKSKGKYPKEDEGESGGKKKKRTVVVSRSVELASFVQTMRKSCKNIYAGKWGGGGSR